MNKLTLFLPAILLVWEGGVYAHGPVRQKLSESIQIDAAPEVVWERLKDFGSVDWIPMVKSVDADGGNSKGATRILTLNNDTTISEKLKKHNVKKMSYSYKIIDMSITDTIHHSGEDVPIKVLPVTDYTATITVKANDSGSDVIWKAAYYRGYMNNNPPKELNEDAAKKAIQTVFRAGLENLKAISESNQPINSSSTSASEDTSNEKSVAPAKNIKKVDFDSNYPAANFEPKVIFINEKLAGLGASSKLKKSAFDANYPAANFEPKVIYP